MIPCLPALIAHPGIRTSAALQQAVSITTEEKKAWEAVHSCMQGWLVWPPDFHRTSWNPQLPSGLGTTPQTEMSSEEKNQPPPQLPWKKPKFCHCLNWNEKLSSSFFFTFKELFPSSRENSPKQPLCYIRKGQSNLMLLKKPAKPTLVYKHTAPLPKFPITLSLFVPFFAWFLSLWMYLRSAHTA